jgi:hypothetical protein
VAALVHGGAPPTLNQRPGSPLIVAASIVRAGLRGRVVALIPTTGRDLLFDLLGLADELGALLASAWIAGSRSFRKGDTDAFDSHLRLLGVLPIFGLWQARSNVASGGAGGWPLLASRVALLAA